MNQPPLTDIEVAAWARAMIAADLPPETLPGVLANLALLAEHIGRLQADE